MTANISAEEKAIIDYVESDLTSSVDNVESEKIVMRKLHLRKCTRKKPSASVC